MDQSNVNSRLRQIQSQKQKLRQRLNQIQQKEQISGQKSKLKTQQSQYNYQQTMAKLLERKKKLDLEKLQAEKLKKIQSQYLQRKAQQQRQKNIQRIRNEKRMIELDVAMKRAVFESVKEKVKGQNSQELMKRIMLRGQEQINPSTLKPIQSKLDEKQLRKHFEDFLRFDQREDNEIRYNINELNEQRMEIFQAKQMAVMRQILLKQYASRKSHPDIDVMKLTRQQLQQECEKCGYDVNQFINPVAKQEIISKMPKIQKDAKRYIDNNVSRIQRNKRQLQIKMEEQSKYLSQINRLKNQLHKSHPIENVNMVKSIIYGVIDSMIFQYEKRITNKTTKQHKEMLKNLEKQYTDLLENQEDLDFVYMIVEGLMETIHHQMIEESAMEVHSLNQFAHRKAEQTLSWLFNNSNNLQSKFKRNPTQIPIQLNFQEQQEGLNRQNDIMKKNNYAKKFDENQNKVFDVDQLTVELINDIQLLQAQEDYFRNVLVHFSNEKPQKETPFLINYDRQLFSITNKFIYRTLKNTKIQKLNVEESSGDLKIKSVRKLNKNWLILDQNMISLYTPWSRQSLPTKIGDRISSKGGKAQCVQFYPVMSFLGSPCSILVGYQKGQILKYNFNTDRISNQQTNITYYQPLIKSVKSGDQPPFPLDYKNPIQVKNIKIPQGKGNMLHQWRQFFDHHTAPIVSLSFYSFNIFISVDANLKCAIWQYDIREGAKSYDPIYTFQFTSSFKIYKESQNAKIRNIFPSPAIKDTQKQLYQKWMQTQSFLKKQVYNNPKKQTAFFMSPQIQQFDQNRDQKNQEKPLWKVNYDDKSQKITKIYESFYAVQYGMMQAITAKLWKNFIFILVERDHVIRSDLKTMKIYGWNIDEKKMRTVGLQFDMFKSQTAVDFTIYSQFLVNVNMPLIVVVSSGRILIFSMISGQLLRNLSDERYIDPGVNNDRQYSRYFFNSIAYGPNYLAAATNKSTVEISLNDRNLNQAQTKLNQILQATKKKYVNLV